MGLFESYGTFRIWVSIVLGVFLCMISLLGFYMYYKQGKLIQTTGVVNNFACIKRHEGKDGEHNDCDVFVRFKDEDGNEHTAKLDLTYADTNNARPENHYQPGDRIQVLYYQNELSKVYVCCPLKQSTALILMSILFVVGLGLVMVYYHFRHSKTFQQINAAEGIADNLNNVINKL